MISKIVSNVFQKSLLQQQYGCSSVTLGKHYFSKKARSNMEDLHKLNEFDEEVKQKYINKKYTDQEFKDMDVNQVKQKITEEYQQRADQLFNDDSILSQIRSDMFDNEEIKKSKQQAKKSQKKRELQPMEKYFNNISNTEFLQKAKELQKDVEFHRLADPEKRTNSISRDYANYSSYTENTVYLKDVRNDWEENPEEVYQGKRIMKFIQNLDSDIKQKKELDAQMKELRSINPDLTDSEIFKKHFDNESEKINKEQNFKYEFDQGDNNIEKDSLQFTQSNRLSPQAKEEIFKLYIKGWSVRDISSRFGIIPERTKAVIWLRQKFYYEVLPNIDLRTLKQGMEKELEFNKEHAYMDYGIDLEELARRNRGILTPSFKKQKDVDTRALQFTEEKTQKLKESIERKKVKKAFVTTGFVGTQEKGYYIKDWVVNYGKGSDKVSRMFKQCVHQSHQPDRLPKKVQKKLNLGPRIASQSFGHK